MPESDLAIREESQPLTPTAVIKQVTLIQQVMKEVMKEGEHWGKIPGCGDKPTLLKPGAEKLCLTFRMAPKYEITINNLPDGHREYEITCSLYHITTGNFLGSGVGVCSTMESKYRYRNAARKCPVCGKEAIIKGKQEYGGGWLCFKRKDGCGAKWDDGAPEIENQDAGRVENDNPADCYNTVKKIGKKRALVDATLTATAASDIFTQDIEEIFAESSSGRTSGFEPGNEGSSPSSAATETVNKETGEVRDFIKEFKEAETEVALDFIFEDFMNTKPKGPQVVAMRRIRDTRATDLKGGE